MIALPLDPGALSLGVLIWPILFGLGAYLVLTAQPIGRPKPELLERLRWLDVDERVRMEPERREARAIFRSRLLETMLRPLLDDTGRLLQAWLGHVGFAGGVELERKLAIARPGVTVTQCFGEKLLSGLIGAAIFPLMNALGVHPFGAWPVWLWLLGGIAGFLAPDWRLRSFLTHRQMLLVMELPVVLDLLCLSTSAGLAVEQAMLQVARQGSGVVSQELQHVSRELTLGQRSLVEALEAMAERAGVPEVWSLTSQLRAAHEHGLPLTQALTVQADAVREAKRLRILAEGGKATVRMLLPVAVLILPVLFVVILYPAGVQLLHLGG